MRSPGTGASRNSLAVLACVAFVTSFLLGCESSDPVTGEPSPADETAQATAAPSGQGTSPDDARMQLAAVAAAAADLRITAFYTWRTANRPDRTVAVTTAVDGTWRVDIPGGALGGAVDVAMAQTEDGSFQCVLPSAARPTTLSCVRLGDPGGPVDPAVDPRLQHLFTDWIAVLADRRAPLAVSVADPLPGTDGTCFSVESTTASLRSPLDVGIYCYRPDGTLTGARLGLGTVVLAGQPGAAPPSITLPGPVTAGSPLGTGSPPAPPSPSGANPG